MTRICLIGDTHVGAKNFNKTVFEKMMVYFETELFPYLIKHNVREVIHLGDLVHNRTLIDNDIDGQFKKRFFRWFEDNKIVIHCLIGNHDSYFKNTIEHNYQSANLREFKYVNIIEKSTILNIGKYKIGFMPWMTKYNEIYNIPKAKEVDILCGHFEIQGALMQGNSFSRKGLNYQEFADYKMVLSGHFHAMSKVGNFRYLGTQYQMNWSDYNNERGFWVLEDNWKIIFKKNQTSPKHLKIYYIEQNNGDIILKLGGLGKNLKSLDFNQACQYTEKNFIKFIVKKYNNQDLLERYFEQISKNSLERVEIINESSIIEDFDFEKYEEDMKEDVDMFSNIENFILNSQFAQKIDKYILVDKVRGLYQNMKHTEI